MKLSRFSKKVIAVLCAVAMVVCTFSIVGQTTAVKGAAPDWSKIEYLSDGAGGGKYSNMYKFYSEDGIGAPVNIQHPGFAAKDGVYITFPIGVTSVSIEAAIQGAGICVYLDNFANKETSFIVTTGDGVQHICWMYYENGGEGPSTSPGLSTSKDPWINVPDGGGQWLYNDSTKKGVNQIVNVQQPGFATERGIYIVLASAPKEGTDSVSINGKTGDEVCAVQGAGMVLYLSAMQLKENIISVDAATGTSYLEIKNTQGSDPTTVDPSAPTTTPGPTTTKSPWTNVPDGGSGEPAGKWKYNTATISNVFMRSSQKAPWAPEVGIYVEVPAGISSDNDVSINGVTGSTVAKVQGSGVMLFLSAMQQETNEVNITYAGGTGYIQIKNTMAPTPTSVEPTEEPSSQETSSVVPTTAEPTTAAQKPAPVGAVIQLAQADTKVYIAWAASGDFQNVNVYEDGIKILENITNGANVDIAQFTPGTHEYQIAGITEDAYGETLKTAPVSLTIPAATVDAVIDGDVYTSVEPGETFDLPNTAEYGYYCETDDTLYKPGATVMMDSSGMEFDSIETITVSNVNGASIRLDGITGIKFKTSIDAIENEKGQDVTSEVEDEFTFGTLITAYDIYSEIYMREFTVENCKAHELYPAGQKGAYKKIDNNSWYSNYTFFGGVMNVNTPNYARNFIARGYVELTYSDETTSYVYTSEGGMPVRSIKQVALAIKQAGYPGLTPEEIQRVDDYIAG